MHKHVSWVFLALRLVSPLLAAVISIQAFAPLGSLLGRAEAKGPHCTTGERTLGHQWRPTDAGPKAQRMAPWLDNTQALLLQGQTAGEPCNRGCRAETKAAMQPFEGHRRNPLLQRSLA